MVATQVQQAVHHYQHRGEVISVCNSVQLCVLDTDIWVLWYVLSLRTQPIAASLISTIWSGLGETVFGGCKDCNISAEEVDNKIHTGPISIAIEMNWH